MILIKHRRWLSCESGKIYLFEPYLQDVLLCSNCNQRTEWKTFLWIKWIWNFRGLAQCSYKCHKGARLRWTVRHYEHYTNMKINWYKKLARILNSLNPLNILEKL